MLLDLAPVTGNKRLSGPWTRRLNSRWRRRSELIFCICPKLQVLISDNTQVRKNYFDSNMIRKENLTFSRRFSKDYFGADVDRSKCLHATSQTRSFARTTLITRFITVFHSMMFPILYYRFSVNGMLELIYWMFKCGICITLRTYC